MLDTLRGFDDLDMWNPNNWPEDTHEHRIYYSDIDQSDYCVVDAIDYPYLSQYCWSIHDRKKHEKGYLYLRRAVHIGLGPGGGRYISDLSGREVWDKKRIQRNMFLHQEIMLRTGIEPPSDKHTEVDHLDRSTRNCRRRNLIWATRSMNVRNSNHDIRKKQLQKRHGKTSMLISH